MQMFIRSCAAAAAFVAMATHAPAGAQVLSPEEIEKRDAAAGFVLPRHATLSMLVEECERIVPAGIEDNPKTVRQGWWQRNRQDVEAAATWIDKRLSALQAQHQAEYERFSQLVASRTAGNVRQYAQMYFRRQLPTAETCVAALKPYAAPQLDIQNIAKNQGYERFDEIADTLRRIRDETGYRVPAHLRLAPEVQPRIGLMASLEAAQAATERRDGEGARRIYELMADRGDARAAQTVGLLLLRGDLVSRDDTQAYLWFFRAWRMGDPEALNAMGTMHRDGKAVPANAPLALALFHVAASQPNAIARSRAEANARVLGAKMTPEQRQVAACMTFDEIAAETEKPVPMQQRPPRKATEIGGKFLRDTVPALADGTSGCK